MRLSQRARAVVAVWSLLGLTGCISNSGNDDDPPATTLSGTGSAGGGNGGSTTQPGLSGDDGGFNAHNDSPVATPAVNGMFSVVVGATGTLSITFTSNDGGTIQGLAINGSLGTLPADWTGPKQFACATVSTGSGCVLNLTYKPSAYLASGTFTLEYVYLDSAGGAQTTAPPLTIQYRATTNDNIVGTATPTGQIVAVVGMGSQTVNLNFTTDDGHPASALAVTTDLTSLPAGWSAASGSFTCASVSTGNGCQLALTYMPTMAAVGTLTLNYSYDDDSGTPKTGSVNIPYAATTNDNAVATASPSGQITAMVASGSQPVTVTFTTDDGNPATALVLTSSLAALPAGWSSTDTTFTCATFSTGNTCQLPLTYAPAVDGSGTLALNFTYTNNAGFAKSGMLNVLYAATEHDNIVWTASSNPLVVTAGSSTPLTVTFTTDDGNVATGFAITSGLSALPVGWSSTDTTFSCASVSTGTTCQLPLLYAPLVTGSGTLTLGYSYVDNAGTPNTGTVSLTYTAN
jgi:hypothetical protein